MSSQDVAEVLKSEGNALFAKKEWARASVKYTEAIAVNENNAVLWANRAACRLQLKESEFLILRMD